MRPEVSALRPLLVLSVLHSLEPGGVERDLLRFTKAWRDQGIDARIALGRWEGRLTEEAPDVPYIIPPRGPLARIETETMWMALKLPAIVRKVRPDVLFFPSNGLMAVAAALRLSLGRECPPIVLRPSNDLRRADTSWLARFVHRRFLRAHSGIYTAIVGMAPPVREEIMTEMGARADQVAIINNAALTTATAARLAAARDATVRDHKGRHYLGIGRLERQKNFELLLDAFARIARPDDRLTIVGEGSHRPALEKRARKLGIAGQLDLPGHHNLIDPWLAEADAFVLSSDFEGFGNVVVEALAAGVPIVATDSCAAMPMLVESAGRLVPIRDIAALAAAMDAICDDPSDIAAARTHAAPFTMEATVADWIALFQRVAA